MNVTGNVEMDKIIEKINEEIKFNEIENSYNRIVLIDFIHFCFTSEEQFSVFLESSNANEKNYCIGISINKKNNPTLNLQKFISKLPKYKTTFSCIVKCNSDGGEENNEVKIYLYFQRTENKEETVPPNIPKLLSTKTFNNLKNELSYYSITDEEEKEFKELYSIFKNLELFQPKVKTELTVEESSISLSFFPINCLHLHHLVHFVHLYDSSTKSIQFNLKKTKEKGEEKCYPSYTFTFKRNDHQPKKRLLPNVYDENDEYSDDDDESGNNNNKKFKRN